MATAGQNGRAMPQEELEEDPGGEGDVSKGEKQKCTQWGKTNSHRPLPTTQRVYNHSPKGPWEKEKNIRDREKCICIRPSKTGRTAAIMRDAPSSSSNIVFSHVYCLCIKHIDTILYHNLKLYKSI